MGRPCGGNNSVSPYLGNIAVSKKDRTCQGLKVCEFAHQELMEMEHESVDTDSDLYLKINEELSANNVKNNTFA
jgi:hypothetical protein